MSPALTPRPGSAVWIAPVGTPQPVTPPRRWYERIPGLRRLHTRRVEKARAMAGWRHAGWVSEDGLSNDGTPFSAHRFPPANVRHLWKEDDS